MNKILRATAFTTFATLGMLTSRIVMAADYSVSIVNAGTGFGGAGTALNLYSIKKKGVDLVEGSPYVFPQPPAPIYDTFEPIVVAMSPDHDFVYVVYVRVTSLPIIVQFAITPHGLEYLWQQELSTGDPTLQRSSIGTVSHYVIEYTYPIGWLWVHILNESGQELVSDSGTNGVNLVSAHIDPNGKFYYSCRYISPSYPYANGPANAVAVYTLDKFVTEGSSPLLTSTDPVFVQSECQ
jgi:hypothetical protein